MIIKYYPINLLQNDTAELELLIVLLRIVNMTKAELDEIKHHIKDFMGALRTDLHVVAEVGYVDRTFRDSFYDYYATKCYSYNRDCVRLSFFDKDFDPTLQINEADKIRGSYMGFLILRPLAKCIGMNVICPEAKIAQYSNIRICKTPVSTSCLGIKLSAVGFPHASQDEETMTCAQTTIWSILEYYGNKYVMYKPTSPTDIEQILEPFSYERLLPSKGLTYNQISVALRKLGFAPKIYYNDSANTQIFKELLACYIESGIPLAVALTSKAVGHAVVCLGTEKFDRMNVLKHPITYTVKDDKGNDISKTFYSWNVAVSEESFVFNDDNFPNYQIATLQEPVKHYTDKGLAKWSGVGVSQFIAPLYSKVYMDAGTARELSLQILLKVIPGGSGCVLRTFLTSSRTFREHLSQSLLLSNDMKLALLQLNMPKFVWVSELSTPDEFCKKQISTLLLLDATGSKTANLARNIILLISDGYLYHYDPGTRQLKGTKVAFPNTMEAFEGNLH